LLNGGRKKVKIGLCLRSAPFCRLNRKTHSQHFKRRLKTGKPPYFNSYHNSHFTYLSISGLTKEDIGVVLDEVGIPECLTVNQVGKVMKHTFQNWNDTEYSRLVQKLALPDKKQFKEFSRGMKMKLGIAIAMSHNSKLLILDEATSGLDPVVRDEVVEMFSEFTRDESHSILISSHIVNDLEKLCDYIAFLHKGKLLLCEEKDLLREEYGLVHCSVDEFQAIPFNSVKYKKENAYGVEAMVLRNAVPSDIHISPISIEELFVFMVKEAK
jgi:ABC-2 type transport system ATP-binding protein